MPAAAVPPAPDPFSLRLLSPAQWGLLTVTFLMWAGFFLIIPLVTVHFVGGLGWAAGAVGVVLGVRQLAQQGLTVLGGAWADRVGPRQLILWGCLLRAVGFAGMAFSGTFAALLISSLVAGVGGALFDAPKSAALSALTRPEHRPQLFSLLSVAGNLGMVLGPLLGAAMMGLGFSVAALISAGTYVLCWLILRLTLPDVRPAQEGGGGLNGLRRAVADRRFVKFTVALIGYFLLSTQLNVAVTLKAVALGGPGATGPLYALNAGLAVLLQYPLLRWAEGRFRARTILTAAVTLAALSLGLMGFAGTFPLLLACAALYSLGTMLVFPTQQTLVSRLAPPELLGSYFGFSAISLGVGGALGNVLGGSLMDYGAALGRPALPWLLLMATGFVTVAALRWALKEVPSAGGQQPG
ncbi:major facilitator superfamily MFS_1 [Deinococcus proteolyticus MRP]|uniref:Major facilitator superfamily MFS_1 n=1 Tax=Deinococcus proteolyticus (strain ATCC 35074 / DSM 20540 / JCM 6276 / NBRC 101906 / NCIMB 13154 / VKM Ac-1939 / CCM 2703 / MRP) TaxID=693977 RepID=F0RP66_DEIPM|nr:MULTISPECIES: MFS transporter [Deinococcus]ADY25381.1 major facilitator superfamily MFS_1 [Deinococcus proteolyticus MRP]MCY1701506.1 MFS transporter [Deinococcus sp. SL84]